MLRRSPPSTVQRLLISNRYFELRSSAVLVRMSLPQYSAMNAPFLMGLTVNRPRPVLDRPTRNGWFEAEDLVATSIRCAEAGLMEAISAADRLDARCGILRCGDDGTRVKTSM